MRYTARLGALWLGLVGALLLLAGIVAVWVGLDAGDPESGWIGGSLFVVGGLFLLVVGAPHMAGAVGVWRRRTWGRWLGAVVGGIGLGFGVFGVVGTDVVDVIGVVMVVGYGLALVGSVIWYPTDPTAAT